MSGHNLKHRHRFTRPFALFTLICTLVFSMGTGTVRAEVLDYPYNYMTLNIRDNVIVTDQNTPKSSPLWAEAGVVNPADRIEDLKGMNVMASFYDPDTKTTVNFIAKKSTDTVKQFTFEGMSDDEIISYVRSGIGDAGDAQIDVSLLTLHGLKFFRVEILVETDLNSALEVLYGTLINGQMVQFDCYVEGESPVIDETFSRELLDGITFTQILTPEDYDELTKASMLKVGLTILAVILIFVALIFVSKFDQARQKKKAKKISEYMQEFHAREQAGAIDRTKAPLFTAETQYTDNLLDDFFVYTTWIKDIVRVAILVLLFGFFVVYLFSHNSIGIGLIIGVAGVVFLYLIYRRSEKQKALLKDQYNTKAKPFAQLRFYDEYFDVMGLGSRTEYIYKQVTDVKIFKTYMYMYLGNEHAVIVDLENVPDGTDRDLYIHVKKQMSQGR